MLNFSLSREDFTTLGENLHRPECVLTTSNGDVYVSDQRGGITLIDRHGHCELFSGQTRDGQLVSANGFALLPNGSFLIAPLCGGAVYQLDRNGHVSVFLDQVEGRALDCPNFVFLDPQHRVWICCLTQQSRTSVSAYSRDKKDGFIALVDKHGARIVKENIGYPNEIRIDAAGEYLYTNETLSARLLRFKLSPDGSLGPQEVLAEFDESYIFDGFTLDSQNGAWITALVSNQLIYVSPSGQSKILYAESHPEQVERLKAQQKNRDVKRDLLYEDHGAFFANPSSIAFGGKDLKTAFVGSLMGRQVFKFQSPVAGIEPAHWNFGPFNSRSSS